MKEVYIINAGGFGRTVASLAQSDAAYDVEWTVKGMLDDRELPLRAGDPWPVVGSPMTHRYQPGQIIVDFEQVLVMILDNRFVLNQRFVVFVDPRNRCIQFVAQLVDGIQQYSCVVRNHG